MVDTKQRARLDARDVEDVADLPREVIDIWVSTAAPRDEFVYSTGPSAGRLRGRARLLHDAGAVSLHCRRVNGNLHYLMVKK